MLVLSRRLQEKIGLPTVSITVQVVEIKRGVVRLGIDAPPEGTVLREEVPDRALEWAEERTRPEDSATGEGDQDEFVRQVHDRLKTTGVGLGLLRLQLDVGLAEEAKATLAGLQDDFQELLHGVEGEIENPPVTPPNKECKSHKALPVEDETDERELLAVFLRRSGPDVDTAGNGADALDWPSDRTQQVSCGLARFGQKHRKRPVVLEKRTDPGA